MICCGLWSQLIELSIVEAELLLGTAVNRIWYIHPQFLSCQAPHKSCDITCPLGWVISHFFQNFNNGVLNFYAYGSKNPCDIIFFWKYWCLPCGKRDFVNAKIRKIHFFWKNPINAYILPLKTKKNIYLIMNSYKA